MRDKFDRFLKKHHIYRRFYRNFNSQAAIEWRKNCRYIDKNYFRRIPHGGYIYKAFPWTIDFDINWMSLNDKWLVYKDIISINLSQNIKIL